jgi:hypothetical protein
MCARVAARWPRASAPDACRPETGCPRSRLRGLALDRRQRVNATARGRTHRRPRLAGLWRGARRRHGVAVQPVAQVFGGDAVERRPGRMEGPQVPAADRAQNSVIAERRRAPRTRWATAAGTARLPGRGRLRQPRAPPIRSVRRALSSRGLASPGRRSATQHEENAATRRAVTLIPHEGRRNGSRADARGGAPATRGLRTGSPRRARPGSPLVASIVISRRRLPRAPTRQRRRRLTDRVTSRTIATPFYDR